MRRGLSGALIAAVIGSTLASPAGAQAPADKDCFWQGGSRAANIAYPDLGARYWVSAFPLPPGTEIVLRGRYPHARYVSFNVYDAAAQPTDGLADINIAPDPGSVNPFVAGAARDAPQRDYTVRVVGEPPPPAGQRSPNTIYLGLAGQRAVSGEIMYRVYVPDVGRDPSGGVGVPEASMRLPDGSEQRLPVRCQPRDSSPGQALDDAHANSDGGGLAPANPAVSDPIYWEAFASYAQAYTYPLANSPAAATRDALVPRDRLGGFLSNIDNAYTLALATRGKGPVAVLEGRAPATPRTLDGRPTMESGQVRYWSLCENELASQRVIDCVYDEQVAVRADGTYTVVMSTPAQRPSNARSDCGVNWIRWGAQPDGLLILRHMLPAPDFAQAIQHVEDVRDPGATMGDYLPAGRHTTPAAFETRGCPA